MCLTQARYFSTDSSQIGYVSADMTEGKITLIVLERSQLCFESLDSSCQYFDRAKMCSNVFDASLLCFDRCTQNG